MVALSISLLLLGVIVVRCAPSSDGVVGMGYDALAVWVVLRWSEQPGQVGEAVRLG